MPRETIANGVNRAVILFNPCDVQSMLDRDLLVEGGDEVRPARVERIKQEVAWACRMRAARRPSAETVAREKADAERAADEDYDRQRAAIKESVSHSADAEQGKQHNTSVKSFP